MSLQLPEGKRYLYCKTAQEAPELVCRQVSNRSYQPDMSSGELLAVMGPSGCGKTTLLNFLSGRLASGSKLRVKGQRLMDGVSPSQSDLRALGAYVEQEDALIGSLTARETIDFAARLAPRRFVS